MVISKFSNFITEIANKIKDTGFYLPSGGGPEYIPLAGTNYGGNHNSVNYSAAAKIKPFGEYRKGSGKYGQLVIDIMMFLRLPEYKDHINDNDGLKFKIEDFESKSNIQVERIQQMLDSNYKLVNFDVNIDGEYIIFKNIKNTKKTRFVWGESANELG